MDAFEGIHSVQISSSPPSSAASSRGYEVLKAGRSGIAVYSSSVFYGTPDAASSPDSGGDTEKEACVVGRYVLQKNKNKNEPVDAIPPDWSKKESWFCRLKGQLGSRPLTQQKASLI